MRKSYVWLICFCAFIIANTGYSQCSITISASPDNPVCNDQQVTFTATSASGNITNYIWVVNGDTFSTAPSFSIVQDGAHIELYGTVDTCGTTLDTVVYSDKNIINVDIEAEYTVNIEECNQPVADVQIGEITGGNEPYTYNFYVNGAGLGQQDLYSDITVSSYPLVVTDNDGCEDTTWVNMNAFECPPPDPIDAFTPNDDGQNDTWFIRNIQFYPDNEVYIFDRWGQRVYHKVGYDNNDGWDAKYIGSNMPVSTYYYIIKIKYKKQDEVVYNGAISIFR